MKKIRFTLRIMQVLNKALTDLSTKQGLTKNALIIQALQEYVQNTKKEEQR